MIFNISSAANPSRSGDRAVYIGDGPQLSSKLSEVWRVYVWKNYKEKKSFHVQLPISLIP